MLVSFGYTYCPDVCPTELQVISAALDELGEKAKDIQPIFITIDPERDTVATLAQYMPNFHPRYIGLTGTPEAIAKAPPRPIGSIIQRARIRAEGTT